VLGVWDFIDSITPAGCRKRGKTLQAPSGGSPKPGPLGPDSLLAKVTSRAGYVVECAPGDSIYMEL